MKKTKQSLTVCKSVSLPLDLLNEVANEAEIMSRDFSSATAQLLRIGLGVRKEQRCRDEEKERGS